MPLTKSDEDILAQQLNKYYGYLTHGKRNEAYDMAESAINDLRDLLMSSKDAKKVLQEFVSVFTLLSEHGFPMGRAQYPGPGEAFKALVEEYLD